MFTVIGQFFGGFLLWLYDHLFSNYTLTLFVFTLLIRLVMFPVTLKSKRSMMQTSALSAEMQKLQKQYAKDQNRLNEETQKLYEREGVNPMGGCLWSLIPMFILMAVYALIRRPLLYMMQLTEEQVTAAIAAVQNLGYTLSTNEYYHEMQVAGLLGNDDVMTAVSAAVGDGADKLQVINFNLFGIDLSQVPTLKFWENFDTLGVWGSIGLFLIPILVILVQFGYTKLSQYTNSWNGAQQANDAANKSTKMMMYMMPLMYLWFGFIMPAVMCVYMIFSSLIMAVQEIICAKMLKKDFEKIKADQERRAQEAKEAEKAKKAEIAARRAAQAEENRKNAKRRKKVKGGVAAQKDRPTADSRVGVRAYARGRAYDPNRYPVTPYRDPADVLDEAALEQEYRKRGHKVKAEEPEEAPAATAAMTETAAAPEAAPETVPAPEAAAEAAPEQAGAPEAEAAPETGVPSADELFAGIQEEANGGASDETPNA